MRLVLASASPRRAELLTAAGFSFATLSVDVDERAHPEEVAEDYVRRLASAKSARALEVLGTTPTGGRKGLPAHGQNLGSDVILAADTAVVVGDLILGKPRDDQDATDMLRRLSGRSHRVITGVSLRTAMHELAQVETTTVWFASLKPQEVEWYVGTGDGRDKAGGYAIQGLASRFIPRIEGSYSNVVGLPIELIYSLLVRLELDTNSS